MIDDYLRAVLPVPWIRRRSTGGCHQVGPSSKIPPSRITRAPIVAWRQGSPDAMLKKTTGFLAQIWLVVTGTMDFFMFFLNNVHSVGNGMSSSQLTNSLTSSFFRGVGIPPTRYCRIWRIDWFRICTHWHDGENQCQYLMWMTKCYAFFKHTHTMWCPPVIIGL